MPKKKAHTSVGNIPGSNAAVTATEKKRILKSRAQMLAREIAREEDNGSYYEVLEFLLAHERYAIETAYVREVYRLHNLTPLPCTPPFILGIVNVRGQLLPVMDIKKFFDLPEKGITDLNKVIIVNAGGVEVGILADVVFECRRLSLHELQPAPATCTGIRAEYLKGVTEEQLIVVDVEAILSDDAIVVHEEVQ